MSTNIYNATTDKLKDIGSGGGGGDPEALEAIENTITPSSTKEEEGAITATKTHSEGDYFNLGGVFVKALDDIAVGDTLTEGLNYEITNVGDELTNVVNNLGSASEKDYTTLVTSGNSALVTSGGVYNYVDSRLPTFSLSGTTLTITTQ